MLNRSRRDYVDQAESYDCAGNDKDAAARLFARIFGLNYDGPMGHFAPVRINDELTLDFDNAESSSPIIMHSTSAMTISMRSFNVSRKLA